MHNLNELIHYKPAAKALAGRNILITGAGDGIGRAAALSFAHYGATVILLGRSEAKLEAVYDEIESSGGEQPVIATLDLDTATHQDYLNLNNEIIENLGALHGLLHNAGILGEMKPLAQYSEDTFARVMNINLTSNFLLTKAVLPSLELADNASIIFTSSSVGRKSRAYWGSYAVSKFATEGLMQTWADEFEGTSNIRANSLNPGATQTSMRRQAYPGETPSDNPTAEEIMGAYLFLMSADSMSVNGEQLNAQINKETKKERNKL
jgi:NAD(P)-dependent dehydrogenase (short-subunit alcohol dehydrogenase family)